MARLDRYLRTIASYVPSRSLLGARRLRDLPSRLLAQPHEPEFGLLGLIGRPGAIVVDIGANRGQTIESLRMVLDSPRVVAIEPNPMLAEHLRRRYPEVVVHNQGIALEGGFSRLYIPRYGHTWFDTRASLVVEGPNRFLDHAMFAWFRPERGHVEEIDVPIGPLDSLGLQPKIIKIDVEGQDELAVRSGLRSIEEHRPALLIERPAAPTSSLLRRLGYTACCFEPLVGSLVSAEEADPRIFNTLYLLPAHLADLAGAGVHLLSGPAISAG